MVVTGWICRAQVQTGHDSRVVAWGVTAGTGSNESLCVALCHG
jgi:hypothetical protein